jgi:DNA-binding HxlR family transcriptional regulator
MALKLRKNRSPPMPCPITQCMAFLGGAWTPNVLWNLSGGPRRFGELRIDMPRITAKVLSARLRELEEKGVIARQVMPTSPPSVEYSLTPLGRELVPAIQSIVRVGQKLRHGSPARAPQHRAVPRGAAPGAQRS